MEIIKRYSRYSSSNSGSDGFTRISNEIRNGEQRLGVTFKRRGITFGYLELPEDDIYMTISQ